MGFVWLLPMVSWQVSIPPKTTQEKKKFKMCILNFLYLTDEYVGWPQKG